MNNKLFSIKTEDERKIITILGLKISFKQYSLKNNSKEIEKQNKYDLTPLKSAKTLIVFFVPYDVKINGGIMSIFSLTEASRMLNPNACTLVSTFPNKLNITYSRNEYFLNNEQIYRWEQVINNTFAEKIILHIPEYYVKDFYKLLKKDEIKKLQTTKNLQINILNQNIELMPKKSAFKNLFKLTKSITQTIAHNRYATQGICNKYGIPTHLFSVNIPLDKYKKYSFEDKENIIVLSPDSNEYKSKIVTTLEKEMSDFELITVDNLTFKEYMDLISRAYFTITFGEGMDGYFTQPQYVDSIGFAVYNDKFFPNKDWLSLKNVYSNDKDMEKNIVSDMKNLLKNKELYYNTCKEFFELSNKIYSYEGWLDNLKRFYKNQYDFLPSVKH